MRRTKSGWRRQDFEKLLRGFGLELKGKKHDIWIHPVYHQIRVPVPRHNKLKEWVAENAVRWIDELKRLQSRKGTQK